MIINFHSDQTAGLLKLIDKNNVPLIITNKLYDYSEDTFSYKKNTKPQKLFISKEKIDSTIFDGWQVLLVSEDLIDNETFNISDNETYIMYHTYPTEKDLENFLSSHSYKHKKKGQHEKNDQWGYNLINYIFDAYSLKGFNIQKYDDAIKKIIDWFDFNEELEAKLELLHSLLVPPANLDKNYTKWDKLNKLSKYKESSQEVVAWKKFVESDINGNAENFHDKPFDEKYIKALEDLRDSLRTD